MPYLVVIGGPNGAGKSTVAPGLLADYLGIDDFVNADVIARGLAGFNPAGADLEAGRIMLRRLRELAADGKDFAFETTLASRSFAPWIAALRATRDYRFVLNYIWVSSPQMATRRVRARVESGGHYVAADVVRRRYEAGLRNFFELYQPIADSWSVFDNSRLESGARLVARGSGVETARVYNPAVWARIRAQRSQ